VVNISPAGDQCILVEKCKMQFDLMTSKALIEQCNISYVWLVNTSIDKVTFKDGKIQAIMYL